jgi:hypothetical protein
MKKRNLVDLVNHEPIAKVEIGPDKEHPCPPFDKGGLQGGSP